MLLLVASGTPLANRDIVQDFLRTRIYAQNLLNVEYQNCVGVRRIDVQDGLMDA